MSGSDGPVVPLDLTALLGPGWTISEFEDLVLVDLEADPDPS